MTAGSKLGGGSPLGTSVSESELSFTDITTANATSLKHGLLPKLSGSASDVLKGDGTFGAGGGASFTALTAGDLTVTNDGSNGKPWVGTFSAAQVQALGAVGNGTLTVATLPAKTYVRNVYCRVSTVDLGGGSGTVSVGRAGATYVDYIAAGALVEFDDVLLGDVSGERGANLTGYDLPSYTTTTAVLIRFTASGATLADININGTVVIDYMVIP